MVKSLPALWEMGVLIPRLGRPPGEGNGYPLQYSCLGNSMAEETGGLQSLGLWRALKSSCLPGFCLLIFTVLVICQSYLSFKKKTQVF